MVSEKTVATERKLKSVPAFIAGKLVDFYGYFISPLFAPRCRFYPTCSGYARDAFRQHGLLKGLVLSTWRVLRCHPWSGTHWHDPVPKRFAWRDIFGYKRIDKREIRH